ncbi:hypothetical protein DSO57_1034266 [Entomophthora muscae]|uniref:Uncharacterized protein n=1 Tax=Entomophthora muscae TaxID=34485 RepID=A0ACC2TMM3_9FUNG|nr:hypothetical protein DSO57_1034266 [Entomophthora muscae]
MHFVRRLNQPKPCQQIKLPITQEQTAPIANHILAALPETFINNPYHPNSSSLINDSCLSPHALNQVHTPLQHKFPNPFARLPMQPPSSSPQREHISPQNPNPKANPTSRTGKDRTSKNQNPTLGKTEYIPHPV